MNLPVSRRLDFSEIPVIDVASLIDENAGKVALSSVAEEIRKACTDVGFFYVCNHGIEQSLIDSVVGEGKRFFCQPVDQKLDVAINPRIRGYLPLYYRSYEGEDRAGTSHQEGFWIGHETPVNPERPLDGPNQWPDGCGSLQQAMNRYFAESEKLSRALQKGFALALGLKYSFFYDYFDNPTSRLKINHYPAQEGDITESNLGVVPHSDSGGYTILWQDQEGGLEIQSKSGEWISAPPVDGSFVINIGNIMQYWSNGLFSSTPHRVVNRSGRDRYSIPLFVNPNYQSVIQSIVQNEDATFEPFHYGKYQVELWRKTFPVAKV
jgi:isopenicillin N synthase-like dioxygenase